MNGTVSRLGAAVVTVTVFLFAVSMIAGFTFGSYVVCMLLPLGYLLMEAGFYGESHHDRRTAAMAGLVFAVVYAALILPVYFAQTTTVRLEELTPQAQRFLDYRRGSLLFNIDLLGYGLLALSTFFTGLSLKPQTKEGKWLKALMLLHGIFFPACFILPMTGVFTAMGEGEGSVGGTAALLVWCAWFLPVGVLAYRHFGRSE